MNEILQFLGFIGVVFAVLVVIAIIYGWGHDSGYDKGEQTYQDWLVEHGVAEWYLNEKHERKWRLIKNRPKPTSETDTQTESK